jgi:hypothetical protein
MPQRISATLDDAKLQALKHHQAGKKGQNSPKNANDHEQRARVHPALPSHSVVVPAPELLSIDVAVKGNIGTIGAFRKGTAADIRNSVNTRSGANGVQLVFTTMD